MIRSRIISVAVTFGLVLSLVTGIAVPSSAGAAPLDSAPPASPWEATDPVRPLVHSYVGSLDTPKTLGRSIVPGTIGGGSGWTIEGWVKIPYPSECFDGECHYFNMQGGGGLQVAYTLQNTKNGCCDEQNWRSRDRVKWNTSHHGNDFTNSGTRWLAGGDKMSSKWHLVTWTQYDTDDPEFYIDGVDVGTTWRGWGLGQSWSSVCLFCGHNSTDSGAGHYLYNWKVHNGGLSPSRAEARRLAIELGHQPQPPAPEPAAAFAPRLACGRQLIDMGNGQWFAETKAVVRNPGQGSDSDGYWKASWEPGIDYPGAAATIPLPAGASTSKSYYVTYFMERTVSVPVGWTLPERQRSVETVDYEVQGGILIPGVSWLFGWKDDALAAGVNNGAVGSGTISFDIESDGYGDPWPTPELAMDVSVIRATCTIRVSPMAAATDNDPDVIVIDIENNDNDVTINPPSDDNPYGEPDPPPETRDVDCGNGFGWNPVSWAKSVYCAIKDLDLSIPNFFDDAALGFIGGLATGWLAKFPLSVISEVVDAFGQTRTALEQGMDSACGPTFTPDLSGLNLWGRDPGDTLRVSLPSPNAECPQSDWSRQAADLGGFRAPLRGFFTVLLWGAFLVRAAHSIGPGRSDISPEG